MSSHSPVSSSPQLNSSPVNDMARHFLPDYCEQPRVPLLCTPPFLPPSIEVTTFSLLSTSGPLPWNRSLSTSVWSSVLPHLYLH